MYCKITVQINYTNDSPNISRELCLLHIFAAIWTIFYVNCLFLSFLYFFYWVIFFLLYVRIFLIKRIFYILESKYPSVLDNVCCRCISPICDLFLIFSCIFLKVLLGYAYILFKNFSLFAYEMVFAFDLRIYVFPFIHKKILVYCFHIVKLVFNGPKIYF